MMKFALSLSLLLVFLTASSVHSQSITGIWRGYFITESGDQYKYEVQLDQTAKSSISGVTYSYLDTRFYGKATFTGNYTKSSNAALVKEIKTVELKMSGSSVACIMKCRLVYSRSGREEFLEGIYTSTYEKSDDFFGVNRGGDCGGGKVFLRKVVTSDFYVEPFLRNKLAKTRVPEKNSPKLTVAKKPASKAPAKTTVAKAAPPKNKPAVTKPAERYVPVPTETKKPADVAVTTKPVITPKIPTTPVTIRERKNELAKTLVLTNRNVEISLYDNGEIDGDTVSIYLNGTLILANQRLSNKPITYKLNLTEENPEVTLVMVAENLGRIPPNTSLMMIQDGGTRHQVSITSTEQKNAMVRFRYEKEGR